MHISWVIAQIILSVPENKSNSKATADKSSPEQCPVILIQVLKIDLKQ